VTSAERIRIINFHGIGSPKRVLDSGESPFWLTLDFFRHLLDRIAEHPERNSLVLTFDDGNSSDLELALPELLERRLSAEFFVLAGRLGHQGSLNAGDVRALHFSGMRIGSHGTDHVDLTGLPRQQLATNLANSKAVLEGICGVPIRSFAIPFGRYNRSVLGAIRKAGFDTAFTSDGGPTRGDRFVLPRRSVRNDMWAPEINTILSGRLPAPKRLRRMASMWVKRLV